MEKYRKEEKRGMNGKRKREEEGRRNRENRRRDFYHKNEWNIPRRERLVRVLLCVYLTVAVIYAFFKLGVSHAHLHLYTVHMHNASFTLYMHTLHEYPRCLKLIALPLGIVNTPSFIVCIMRIHFRFVRINCVKINRIIIEVIIWYT